MKLGEDFYRRILEESHDEICVSDKDGVMLFCNKSFEENYGISKDDMIGKGVEYLQENGYATKSPIPKVILTKKKFTIEQKTHTGKTLIITAIPIFDSNGDIEYIMENVRDITELNEIKHELESKEKEVLKYKSEVETLYKSTLRYEDEVICGGPIMEPIITTAKRIANANVNVMILGESGTGKSSIARYIHRISKRAKKPFITINCTTIPSHLLESELFGYKAGAFTGANSKGKVGLVELADGGTLFLDEIGDIPLDLQAKFLQLIQERTFIPVGGVKPKKVNIRIISATNADIMAKVKDKSFREDLYYRLNVIEIKLPPLRKRGENLIKMIRYYFKRYCKEFGVPDKTISREAVNVLSKYSFPGNIRELQNIMQKIVLTSPGDCINASDLPYIIDFKSEIKNPTKDKDVGRNDNLNNMANSIKYNSDNDELNFDDIMNEFEKIIISDYYSKYKSTYKIAEKLGISQSKASRLVRKHLNSDS